MKKYLVGLFAIVLCLVLVTGCGKSESNDSGNGGSTDNGGSKTSLGTCENCVFAYYKTGMKFGSEGDVLTDYTKDYTTLKDDSGNQRNVFLGHILDDSEKITRVFACTIKDGKMFCLEGGKQSGNEHPENKKVLDSVYASGKCKESGSMYECRDSVIANSNSTGSVMVQNGGICNVNPSTNKAVCY